MGIPLGRTISRLIWLAIAAVMASLCALTLWYLTRAIACREWPVAKGLIVSAERVKHTPPPTPTGVRPSVRHPTHNQPATVTYEAKILYSYSIDGVPYFGTRISFSDFAGYAGTSEYVSARLARYSTQKEVAVHYHPAKPMLAVLETQLRWPNIILPILFALASGLCWLGFRRGWRLWLGRYRTESS